MVLPNHIAEAERNGMPEYLPERRNCPACGEDVLAEIIEECATCGRECCTKCCVWVDNVALMFCSSDCAIKELETMVKRLKGGKDEH